MSDTDDQILMDAEFEAKIRDVSLIKDRKEAVSIGEELERGAANIVGQIDAFRIEMSARLGEMPEDRLAWCRRASFALSLRRQEIERVRKRERELRGVYRDSMVAAAEGTKRAELREGRLIIEAEAVKARKAASMAESERQILAMTMRKTFERVFIQVAREALSKEQFWEIWQAARERAPAIPEVPLP